MDYARSGAEQPKVYRRTRTSLKIRSTPTDGEQKAQMREWMLEKQKTESFASQLFPMRTETSVKNSQEHSSPSSLAPPLPTLDLPESENFSENREENSQLARPLCTSGTTLGNAPDAPNAPVQGKSRRDNFGKPAKKYSDQLYL